MSSVVSGVVRSLGHGCLLQQQCCSISNAAILKPRPRSYPRRLMEAALKPILPVEKTLPAERCRFREDRQKAFLEEISKLKPIELALVRHIKQEYSHMGLIAICQRFAFSQRTVQIHRGLMRMDGLLVKGYSNRVMKELIRGTRLASLDPLFTGDNCIIFGQGMDQLPALVKHTKKHPWLILLAVAVEDKILTAEEAEKIASVASIDVLRSETVSLLFSIPSDLSRLLLAQLTSLTQNLDLLENSKNTQTDST